MDPETRTHAALAAMYAYYRRTSAMWRVAYRDRDDMPALQGPMREFDQYVDGIREDLIGGWTPGRGVTASVRAILGHCLEYSMWRSLSAQGLDDAAIAALGAAWVRCTVNGPSAPAGRSGGGA